VFEHEWLQLEEDLFNKNNIIEEYNNKIKEFNLSIDSKDCEIINIRNDLEKYKEIIAKSNDSSNRAQQYLDGILKIPFGVYKKEKIIEFLNIYSSKISRFLSFLTL
jgi:ATP-dependent Lon protease